MAFSQGMLEWAHEATAAPELLFEENELVLPPKKPLILSSAKKKSSKYNHLYLFSSRKQNIATFHKYASHLFRLYVLLLQGHKQDLPLMISVFEYTDYRLLIRDLVEEHKKSQPFFSYRYIGQKVGFTSAGFLTNIIQGKRNISAEIIFKFAELFKFNKKESEYFETLVLYDQSKLHAQKRSYYEKLLSMSRSKARQLAADQYEYFDKWYYVAVRELLNYYPFKGNFLELGRMLRPSIAPSEAKKAVDLLERLGLVKKQADDSYSLSDKTVTAGQSGPLVAIHNFQQTTMDMAKQAIDRFARNERSISTLTLSLSESTYKAIEEKLMSFEDEVLELVKNDQKRIDRVYQFNFQIYPVTGIMEEKKEK